jgi:hypothetical protein
MNFITGMPGASANQEETMKEMGLSPDKKKMAKVFQTTIQNSWGQAPLALLTN